MTQLRTRTLHEVLAGLLVPMAAALLITHLGGLTHGSGCMVPKAVLLASASKLWRHYHWRGSDFLVTVAGSVLCQKPTGIRASAVQLGLSHVLRSRKPSLGRCNVSSAVRRS
jgi:hypothetical protein